jgi:hypothetical protein
MTIDPHYGTRAEHLALCKRRALEYVDAGDLQNAMASMLSDMRKHPDTNNGEFLGVMMLSATMDGSLDDPAKMRRWIEGFQ